jgi:hypothetical protein
MLLAHATWIAAESPQALHRAGHNFALQNCCSPMQPGKAEDLERKARFLAQSAKNARIFS